MKSVFRVLWVIVILLLLLFVAVPLCQAEYVVTEYKSVESEQFLWETLTELAPSEEVAAGIMGYFWRESQFRSDSVSSWATQIRETGFDVCEYVVSKTDAGLEDGSSKDFFIETVSACGGFGLGQWHSLGYLNSLYDFAQECGTSIADARMQCTFVLTSMQSNTELWEALLSCDDPGEAGWLIAVLYDGTQDGAGYMRWKAQEIFGRMEDG